YDVQARTRIDCDVPLPMDCRGSEYLEVLRERLPGFLDSVARRGSDSGGEAPLGIYNAGTDVVAGDPLGGLALSAEDVLARDLFVMKEFRKRGMPAIMVTSGGYTKESYQLIAASVAGILTRSEG